MKNSGEFVHIEIILRIWDLNLRPPSVTPVNTSSFFVL